MEMNPNFLGQFFWDSHSGQNALHACPDVFTLGKANVIRTRVQLNTHNLPTFPLDQESPKCHTMQNPPPTMISPPPLPT